MFLADIKKVFGSTPGLSWDQDLKIGSELDVSIFVLQSVSGMANCTAAGTSLLTSTGAPSKFI